MDNAWTVKQLSFSAAAMICLHQEDPKSHNGIMAFAYTQISEFCINLQWTIPFAARDNSWTVRKKKDYKNNGWMIILNKNISYCVQFDADQ